MNLKVVFLSIIGIGFIVLMFATGEWLFIIGAVVVMLINQRELNKDRKSPSGGGSDENSGSDSGGD